MPHDRQGAINEKIPRIHQISSGECCSSLGAQHPAKTRDQELVAAEDEDCVDSTFPSSQPIQHPRESTTSQLVTANSTVIVLRSSNVRFRAPRRHCIAITERGALYFRHCPLLLHQQGHPPRSPRWREKNGHTWRLVACGVILLAWTSLICYTPSLAGTVPKPEKFWTMYRACSRKSEQLFTTH